MSSLILFHLTWSSFCKHKQTFRLGILIVDVLQYTSNKPSSFSLFLSSHLRVRRDDSNSDSISSEDDSSEEDSIEEDDDSDED